MMKVLIILRGSAKEAWAAASFFGITKKQDLRMTNYQMNS